MFTRDCISPTAFYVQDRTLIGKHPISSAHNSRVPPDLVAHLSAVFLDYAGGDVLFFKKLALQSKAACEEVPSQRDKWLGSAALVVAVRHSSADSQTADAMTCIWSHHCILDK